MDSLFIVDDDIELLCLYSRVLSICGRYDIAGVAGSGRDALDKYKNMERRPDLILMDVNMPDIDGIRVAMELRQYDRSARIIFVTGEMINAPDLPPDISDVPILRKPFSIKDFLSAIRRVLSSKSPP
jgi:two-component system chemotaxis response regulator CheY